MKKHTIDLFEPCKIGRLELRNRFMRSATWDATADSSGATTDNSVALYQELGQGGVGLIVTGFAYISPLGQAVPGQYGVHTDNMISGLRRLVQVAHHGGAKIALQLVHAGINSRYIRQIGKTPLAVSRMQGIPGPHREMTDEDIEVILSDFASAALRAQEAGFDAVQLHGAHGYLMSQFMSPLFNFRSDRWGGNAENRRRFHLKVIQKLRQAVGVNFPLLIKFGVLDDIKGGLSLSEGLETGERMVEKGINAIEVSAGVSSGISAYVQVRRKKDPERAYFRERTAAVKRAVTVPVMMVGGIRSLAMVKSIVDSGDADLISMCRPFIREPDLILRWQRGEEEPAKCISCNKCEDIAGRGELLKCGKYLWLEE